jgi:hypothetical protein
MALRPWVEPHGYRHGVATRRTSTRAAHQERGLQSHPPNRLILLFETYFLEIMKKSALTRKPFFSILAASCFDRPWLQAATDRRK